MTRMMTIEMRDQAIGPVVGMNVLTKRLAGALPVCLHLVILALPFTVTGTETEVGLLKISSLQRTMEKLTWILIYTNLRFWQNSKTILQTLG
jgi:hypothetical protein